MTLRRIFPDDDESDETPSDRRMLGNDLMEETEAFVARPELQKRVNSLTDTRSKLISAVMDRDTM